MSRKKTAKQRREQYIRAGRDMAILEMNSLDCCQSTITGSVAVPNNWIVYDDIEQETKESAMRATIDTAGDASLNYIVGRLGHMRYEKEEQIRDRFRDVRPKDRKEAAKWFKDGFFFLAGAEEDSIFYPELKWGKEIDYSERDAQIDQLYKAFNDAKDIVSVKTDEDARLKALKDFEAYAV